MLKLNKRVAYRFIDDETIFLNLDTDSYYSLNRTGTFVFKKIVEEEKNVEKIAGELAEKEGVAFEKCLADVKELVEDLINEQILVRNAI